MDTSASLFTQRLHIKDDKFEIENLHNYVLSLFIGYESFQLCVVDGKSSRCLLLEDYQLHEVTSIPGLINALQQVFDQHHLLLAGFWHSIKVCVKNQHFSFVPSAVFQPASTAEYLKFSTTFDDEKEAAYFYRLTQGHAICTFSIDHSITSWLKSIYPNARMQFLHQAACFTEGILKNKDKPAGKCAYLMKKDLQLHIAVCEEQDFIFYNRFDIEHKEDFLRYTMTVFKALDLKQEENQLIIFGDLNVENVYFKALYQYIRKLSFGSRGSHLTFGYKFDEILEHQYPDVFSSFFCD